MSGVGSRWSSGVAGLLLQLAVGDDLGTEVGDGGGHHHHVRVVDAPTRPRAASPRRSRRERSAPPAAPGRVSGPEDQTDVGALEPTPPRPPRRPSSRVERFPMKRTGSIGSWVGPAVTTIRDTVQVAPSRDRALDRAEDVLRLGETAEPFVAGGERPDDRARRRRTPRSASVCDVRGGGGVLPHAGVHRGGHDQRAGRLQQRRGEQVVGDARARASRSRWRWRGRRRRRRCRARGGRGRPRPGCSHSEVCTGLPVSAANVSAPTNRSAECVRITRTSAPASTRSRASNPPCTPRCSP